MRKIVLQNLPSKGYDFASTEGFTAKELELIYQNAMPKGDCWHEPAYRKMRSFKTFMISSKEIAFSRIHSVEAPDDKGRFGILYAEISVVPILDYTTVVYKQMSIIEAEMNGIPYSIPLSKVLHQVTANRQLRIVTSFTDIERWALVEISIFKFVLSLPSAIRPFVPFTTFALSHRGEALIVGLPENNENEYDPPYLRFASK